MGNGISLGITVILSLISFVLTVAGAKTKNLIWVFYGGAAGLAAVDVTNPNVLLTAVFVAGFGFWLGRRF